MQGATLIFSRLKLGEKETMILRVNKEHVLMVIVKIAGDAKLNVERGSPCFLKDNSLGYF